MLTVTVRIAPAVAIRAGNAQAGTFAVQIDDAFVAQLDAVHRDTLIRALQDGAPFTFPYRVQEPAPITQPTQDALRAWIVAASDILQAHARAEAEKKAAELQAEILKEAQALDAPIDAWIRSDVQQRDGVPRTHYWAEAPLYIHAESPLRDRLHARLEEAKLVAGEKNAVELAAWQEKVAAYKAKQTRLAEEKETTIRAFLAQHATPTQQQRYAAGFMGKDELRNIVRDVLFAPFNECARYTRIDEADIEHDDDCDNPDYRFEVTAAQSLTDEEYGRYFAIANTAKTHGMVAEARVHRGECMRHGCPGPIVRNSVRVTAEWLGEEFSREYAL